MARQDKIYAWMLGTGLILFPIHNKVLTELASSSEGTNFVFVPIVGLLLIIYGALFCLGSHYREITLGSKWIWTPLSVICLSISLSSMWQVSQGNTSWKDGLAPTAFAMMLFASYLASRILGREILKPMPIAVTVVTIGVIISQVARPSSLTGGLVFEYNSDIASGFLLLGALLSISQRQWIVVTIGLVGLIMTGSPEAYFGIAVIVVVILVRRDWSKKILLPVGLGLGLLIVGLFSGYAQPVIGYMLHVANINSTDGYSQGNIIRQGQPIVRRLTTISEGLPKIEPLGTGYTTSNFTDQTIHNVPLVIAQQIGWAAAIAWLVATIYSLLKARYKYALIGILAMSVFDHYVWTQLAPW